MIKKTKKNMKINQPIVSGFLFADQRRWTALLTVGALLFDPMMHLSYGKIIIVYIIIVKLEECRTCIFSLSKVQRGDPLFSYF